MNSEKPAAELTKLEIVTAILLAGMFANDEMNTPMTLAQATAAAKALLDGES